MLNKNDGMAYLEIIPLIVLLMVLLKYTFGFFGVVHTGILNTIAARNYAFETFRHRANLNYFRMKIDTSISLEQNALHGNRYHSIYDERKINQRPLPYATVRSVGLPFTDTADPRNNANVNYHNNEIMNEQRLLPGKRYQVEDSGSDPVWVQERYGICLDANCGG